MQIRCFTHEYTLWGSGLTEDAWWLMNFSLVDVLDSLMKTEVDDDDVSNGKDDENAVDTIDGIFLGKILALLLLLDEIDEQNDWP